MVPLSGGGGPPETDPAPARSPVARRIHVAGRVQGVGFRPFVALTAGSFGLAGWVRNVPDGVEIHVEGPADRLDAFAHRLQAEAPVAAEIHAVGITPVEPRGGGAFFHAFRIVESATAADTPRSAVPVVPPDRASCPVCQAEFLDPTDHRHGFALTACTACGPRLTAIASLPFDRVRTSMEGFPLCPACRREYEDPRDRRFHAEMTACATCGPRLRLEGPDGTLVVPGGGADDLAVLSETALRVVAGAIVAVQGIGGFHLVCDATSEEAVARLRHRKRREGKPFAVLFGDLAGVLDWLEADDASRRALESPAAPIVLLPRRAGASNRLAPSVAPGIATVGAMLAYTPAHRALVRLAGRPLVATSANASDEPMPIDAATAHGELKEVADAFLLHDRPILRPADDSVVRVVSRRAVPLRVGRGLAPVRVNVPAKLPPMVGVGGHLKAALAFARGDVIVLGPHVGDLATPAVRRRYREVLHDFGRLLGIEPEAVVCDAHPDYFSTRVAQESGRPVISVQHHVAHAAATLAEHGEGGPALAVCWDGTGLGLDGGIWGGEFFRVGPGKYERVGSLWPFPLVGGDRAAREPRRSPAGVLAASGLWPSDACAGWFTSGERSMLDAALRAPHASAVCTSAGRLFDAWAALLGLSERAAFEAEPALRLEDAADPDETGAFPVKVTDHAGAPERPAGRIDWRPWVAETLDTLRRGVGAPVLAARFHQSLADSCVEIARRVGLETVVLGGGCFQNARLPAAVEGRLRASGFRVLTPPTHPTRGRRTGRRPGVGGGNGVEDVKIGGLGEICVPSRTNPGENRR